MTKSPTQLQSAAVKDTPDIDVEKTDSSSCDLRTDNAQTNNDQSDDDYDEENDDNYDPTKAEEKNEDESSDDDKDVPDYSAVAGVSQVRTRGQLYSGGSSSASKHSDLVQDELRIDVAAVFSSLDSTDAQEWCLLIPSSDKDGKQDFRQSKQEGLKIDEKDEQIQIVSTYTFAGKLVREQKLVSANSAEARAYLNSTSGLVVPKESPKGSVTVIRQVQGTDEERPLRIKLKRSSLIDKFLARDKKNKLTTLEKSRLDWASFVDKKRIKDDLAQHNKGGYLEKQDFLNGVESKRDQQYQQAKELDRKQQWQQQQKLTP